MSLAKPTQTSSVLVAIDIAKSRHEVLIEAPAWEVPQEACAFQHRCGVSPPG